MSVAVEDIYQLLYTSKQKAFDNPEWFFKEILQQDLEPWQLQGIEAIADVFRVMKGEPTRYNHQGLSRISVRSCHGPGKTHWLALIMHWWNYIFYGKVVCTAPKEKQLKTRLWPRYRKILRGSQNEYKSLITVNMTDVKIVEDEDWGCVAETASDPENMAGYHDEPQLFLVDEGSARVLDAMYPVIEGALTTPGSVLVVIGNPTRTSGEFWASHNKKGTRELYYQMHIKPEASRFVDPKWVEAMKNKYGKDSPVVKVRVLGEFAEVEENQLLAMAWLDDAKDNEFKPDGSITTKRMTIDVADGGEDETIIIIGELHDTQTHFLKMKRFSFPQRTATNDIIDAAIRMFDAHGLDKSNDDIVVDSIGVGTGVASGLIKKGYNVVRFKGGSTENVDTKKYRNQRVKSYIVLRDEFLRGSIYYHEDFCEEQDWEEYLAQMSSVKTKPGLERVEDLMSKQDMKREGVKSPDMADATSMMYSTMSPELGDTNFSPILTGTMETANADW